MKAIVMNRAVEEKRWKWLIARTRSPARDKCWSRSPRRASTSWTRGVRRGQFWTEMPPPRGLGVEGVGRVLAVGDGVLSVQPGQRVAWVYAPGSYAERIAVSADALVRVPDVMDDRTAAALMMQGLTASHFATNFYCVQPEDVALVHAAAGGLGLLLTQIIKLRGGRVIGRVSNEDKVAIVKDAGADHVIVDTEGQFAREAIRLSGGEGVHVV